MMKMWEVQNSTAASGAVYRLSTRLESAADYWEEIAMDTEYESDALLNHYYNKNADSLKHAEHDVYTAMSDILEALDMPRMFDASWKSSVSSKRGMASTTNLRERQLFWYRFFGPKQKSISFRTFTKALHMFLQQEYDRTEIPLDTLQAVVKAVADVNSDDTMQVEEWETFIFRFGPLRDCYDKAKRMCKVVDNERTGAKDKIVLAEWFRHISREKCEVLLNRHKNNTHVDGFPPTTFYVRPGKKDIAQNHAFTFSMIQGENKPISVRIRMGEYLFLCVFYRFLCICVLSLSLGSLLLSLSLSLSLSSSRLLTPLLFLLTLFLLPFRFPPLTPAELGKHDSRLYKMDGGRKSHQDIVSLLRAATERLEWPDVRQIVNKTSSEWNDYEEELTEKSEGISEKAKMAQLIEFIESHVDETTKIRVHLLALSPDALTSKSGYSKKMIRQMMRDRNRDLLLKFTCFREPFPG